MTGTNARRAKLASIDLIGVPWQIVVGPRGMASGVVEVKNRRTAKLSNFRQNQRSAW